jgi:hypothetical protein
MTVLTSVFNQTKAVNIFSLQTLLTSETVAALSPVRQRRSANLMKI